MEHRASTAEGVTSHGALRGETDYIPICKGSRAVVQLNGEEEGSATRKAYSSGAAGSIAREHEPIGRTKRDEIPMHQPLAERIADVQYGEAILEAPRSVEHGECTGISVDSNAKVTPDTSQKGSAAVGQNPECVIIVSLRHGRCNDLIRDAVKGEKRKSYRPLWQVQISSEQFANPVSGIISEERAVQFKDAVKGDWHGNPDRLTTGGVKPAFLLDDEE